MLLLLATDGGESEYGVRDLVFLDTSARISTILTSCGFAPDPRQLSEWMILVLHVSG